MPRAQASSAAAVSAVAGLTPAPSAKEAASPAPRLLIVDDIGDNRAVLTRRFQRRHFEVTEADCGPRALKLIEQQDFDLVLLDVMMPGMSGIEVLQRIRQKHSASVLPVIMVTAKSQSEDIVGALEFGANDYLTKPVDFAVALARIGTQLERKRAEEAVRRTNEELLKVNDTLEERVTERTQRLVEANQQLQREISERLRSEAHSHYLAHHDALTGLDNRLLFQAELEKALLSARRSHAPVAVLFIDLDGFKGVNDALGHSIGDQLLRIIAHRLRDYAGDDLRVARLGGDEFAVLQTDAPQPQAGTQLARHMIELIGAPAFIDGHDIHVGASIGISIAENGAGEVEQMLKSADLAMYRAKSGGRGTYCIFDPEMDAAAQARRKLEIELRAALATGAFELYFQPIVTLENKKVSGFEALIRWHHPERGMISPSEFIPFAEETGLIVPIGEWALRQACAEAASWPENIKVAVNLSTVQFLRGNIVATVANALAASGLPAARLELEITESVLLEKTDRNITMLNRLRELGVRISMDDFGTGYSSLSYLRSFQFDKIKIDQSFVREISGSDQSKAIVKAITGLGTSFAIVTTAEGVETDAQADYLLAEGCTEVQGFLFSKPIPADEIQALLHRMDV